MGKKDEYRFTIRFDPDDDRHRMVAQILNSQGRKIARYVARAILAYNGDVSFSGNNKQLADNAKEELESSDTQERIGSGQISAAEEEYEMDEDEIVLLKNANHMFRRK